MNNHKAKAQAQEIIKNLESFISTVDVVGVPGALTLFVDGKNGIISKIQNIRDIAKKEEV